MKPPSTTREALSALVKWVSEWSSEDSDEWRHARTLLEAPELPQGERAWQELRQSLLSGSAAAPKSLPSEALPQGGTYDLEGAAAEALAELAAYLEALLACTETEAGDLLTNSGPDVVARARSVLQSSGVKP